MKLCGDNYCCTMLSAYIHKNLQFIEHETFSGSRPSKWLTLLCVSRNLGNTKHFIEQVQ